MGERRLDTDLPGAPLSKPRGPNPLEVVILLVGGCAFAGLLIGSLLEVRWVELWRWLIYGALAPVLVAVLVSIVYLAIRSYNAGMWEVERRTGRDLDGDGAIGRPHPVLVNPRQGQAVARRQTEAEYKANFEAFILGCETDTTYRRWQQRGVSRAQYFEWRDLLLGAGYAAWNNDDPRQGWRLLQPAEQIIGEIWRA